MATFKSIGFIWGAEIVQETREIFTSVTEADLHEIDRAILRLQCALETRSLKLVSIRIK